MPESAPCCAFDPQPQSARINSQRRIADPYHNQPSAAATDLTAHPL